MGPEAVGVIVAFIAVLLFAVRASGRAVQTMSGMFRAPDLGWPSGVQEDDDLHWSWAGARARTAPQPARPAEPDWQELDPLDAAADRDGRCSGTGIRSSSTGPTAPGHRRILARCPTSRSSRAARSASTRPASSPAASRRGSAVAASGPASITLAFPVEGADDERRRGAVAGRRWRRPRPDRRARRADPGARPPGLAIAVARPRRHRLAACRRARPRHRWPPARARLPAAGLLLLRVRGGDVVRHRPAHLTPPERGDQGRPVRAGWATGRRWPGRRSPRSRARRDCSSSARRAGSTPRRSGGCTGSRTAALEGRLDTESLRAMPEAEALAQLQTCPAWGRSPRTASCIAAAASPMACPAATSSVARWSGTCTGSRAPRARTWSDSRRRGGRTGCGRSCCCGWRWTRRGGAAVSYRRERRPA